MATLFSTKKPLPGAPTNAKPVLHQRPDRKRTVEDFPQYTEAVETLRRLQIEQRKIAEECRRAESSKATVQDSRIGNYAANMIAKALGKPESAMAVLDPTEVAEKRAAIESAITQQSRKIEQIKQGLTTELYRDWEEEHFAARVEIADCIVRLKKAFDEENELAQRMYAMGALHSSIFGSRLWINMSCAAQLVNALRTMNLQGFIETNRNLLD
jgi:hypothetical protein